MNYNKATVVDTVNGHSCCLFMTHNTQDGGNLTYISFRPLCYTFV